MESKYLTFEYSDTDIKPKIITGYKPDANDKIDLSTSKGYAKSDDDVLYVCPGTVLPRFKLRDKFKLTNKIEKATVVFIPTNIKAFSNSSCYEYSDADVRSFASAVYGAESPKFKLINSLINSYNYVGSWDENWYEVRNFNNTIIQFGTHRMSYNYINIYTLSDAVKNVLNKATCPVYAEDELVPYLNEDSYVIDHERYNEMKAMFNTADKDTIILGMELLANTDYDKSLIYILLLLKEFGHKFYSKKQVDHVNFKALLNYIGVTKKQLKRSNGTTQWRLSETITLNDVCAILKHHNQFTKTNVSNITTLFLNETPNDENKKYFYTNVLNINVNAF